MQRTALALAQTRAEEGEVALLIMLGLWICSQPRCHRVQGRILINHDSV